MPRRDGTGPMGAGAMSGRGLGLCTGDYEARRGIGIGMGLGPGRAYGRGFGCGLGRGLGRGFTVNQVSLKTQKDLLHEQKTILQNRLEDIDKQLKSL